MPASPAEFAGAKRKYPRAEALTVAEGIVASLRDYCARIEIAGSIRRGKPEVSDIEIVFIPRIEPRPDPSELFGNEILVDAADDRINFMANHRVLLRRLNTKGHETWGAHNKLAVHYASGIPVDFFATTAENWFVALVVRTGSLETNLRLTQGARERGRTLLAYGAGVKNLSTGEVTRAESERAVFELCGVPFIDPQER